MGWFIRSFSYEQKSILLLLRVYFMYYFGEDTYVQVQNGAYPYKTIFQSKIREEEQKDNKIN